MSWINPRLWTTLVAPQPWPRMAPAVPSSIQPAELPAIGACLDRLPPGRSATPGPVEWAKDGTRHQAAFQRRRLHT